MDDWMKDPALWIYLLTLLVSLYGSGLFFWWWIKKRGASSVFMYVTFIFLGETIETAITMGARYRWVSCGIDSWHAYVNSWFWPLRMVVLTGALLFIVVHMTWRVFQKSPEKNRRETE